MRALSEPKYSNITTGKNVHDKIKVIYVDHNANELIITKRWIEKFEPKINLSTTPNQEEVFESYQMYDCILADYKMPKMNGILFAAKIREKSTIPIILYTAQGSEKIAAEAFSVGINDYILKDFDRSHLHVLANKILNVVDRHRAEIRSENYRRKIETLHRSTAELTKVDNIESITPIILNAIDIDLGFHWAGFGLVEENAIRYVDYLGFSTMPDFILPLDGPGVTVRCVNTKESQLVNDVRADPDYVKIALDDESNEILSELAVPVKINGKVVAVINIESEALNAFSIEDQNLIELLAKYVSATFERINRLEEIQKMNENYRKFIEFSPEAVCVISNERYVFCNDRWLSLLGYDVFSEVQNKFVSETIAPEHRNMVMTRIRGRSKGEIHPARYELKLLKKDGSVIDVETIVSVIEYEGTPTSLAFTREITRFTNDQ